MTTAESLGRSAARAHLSQLIELFGTDGCLRVVTASASASASGATGRAPAPASDAADAFGRGEPDGDERA
ncbi:hypothetical protein AB0467_01805 [Streptomyces sp. NPDC052095]|uniref:hypothetical protein n=1 Tax=unclassified Streptomyces TaxID=2593676 RepID=UPI00344D9028